MQHLARVGGGGGGQQLECGEGKEEVVAKLRGGEEKSLEQQRQGDVREGLKARELTASQISESGENMEVAREVQPGAIKGVLKATLPPSGGLMATLPRLPPSSPRCRLSLALSEPGGSSHYRPAELVSPQLSPVEMSSPSLRPVSQLMSPNLRPGARVRPVEQGSSGIVMGQASLTLTRASPRLRQIRTSPLLRPVAEQQQSQASPRPRLERDPTSPIFRPASFSLGSSQECWQASGLGGVSQSQQSPSLRPSTSTATPRLRPSASQTRVRPASVASPQHLWHPPDQARPDMVPSSCLPFCPAWPG